MHTVLLSAIERGEIETQSDRITQNYTREHRAILKQPGVPEASLPHPEVFYFDVFSAAFALVSQRKSPRDYQAHRSTLFENQTKFFALAIKQLEDKKKHPGHTVDFESKTVFHASKPTVKSSPAQEPTPK